MHTCTFRHVYADFYIPYDENYVSSIIRRCVFVYVCLWLPIIVYIMYLYWRCVRIWLAGDNWLCREWERIIMNYFAEFIYWMFSIIVICSSILSFLSLFRWWINFAPPLLLTECSCFFYDIFIMWSGIGVSGTKGDGRIMILLLRNKILFLTHRGYHGVILPVSIINILTLLALYLACLYSYVFYAKGSR